MNDKWKCPECGGMVADNHMTMVTSGEVKEVLECEKCHELFVRDSFIKLWDIAYKTAQMHQHETVV